ncbi:MAG: hypothetical protein LC748_01185, partial [Thermomicrobia bacterium]|nr:hypothetical protein [Thermomicrobia bacterium]
IIGALGYRWLGPLLGWSGLLAAFLVWRAVAVNAGREVEIEGEGLIATIALQPESEPDGATEATAPIVGK